jgi:sporulation protein YlmC with PRC-barrel domain
MEGPMKLSMLTGMPVVSVADGTKLGAIRDVFLDMAELCVAALLLSGERGEALVPFAAIRGIGGDAVSVAAATHGATWRVPPEGWYSLRELTHLKVVNSAGTYLGEVREVDFDPRDGRVGELVARRGGLLGLGGSDVRVPTGAIRGVGAQLVTVHLPAPIT